MQLSTLVYLQEIQIVVIRAAHGSSEAARAMLQLLEAGTLQASLHVRPEMPDLHTLLHSQFHHDAEAKADDRVGRGWTQSLPVVNEAHF